MRIRPDMRSLSERPEHRRLRERCAAIAAAIGAAIAWEATVAAAAVGADGAGVGG